MTLTRGLVAIAVSAVVCGAAGMAVGMAIGRWAPDAYRAVFQRGGAWQGPPLDPEQIGLGLGLAQGVLVGVFAGAVVVGLVTWYEIRTRRHEP